MLTRVEWAQLRRRSSRRSPPAPRWPEPADLAGEHRAVRPARGADGPGPGAHRVPRPVDRPLARAAPPRAAAGGRRHRAALHLRPRGLLGHSIEVLGLQIAFSTTAVVMAQTFVALPFLVVSLEGALRTGGQRFEEVAATLGARPDDGAPCASPSRWSCPGWRRVRCSPSPGRSASSAPPSPSPAACRASPARCRWRSTCSARPTRGRRRPVAGAGGRRHVVVALARRSRAEP